MNNEERRRRAIAHFAREAARVNAKLSEEQEDGHCRIGFRADEKASSREYSQRAGAVEFD
ncbi:MULTISPECIES: hypothetical protein [Thalassospira]|jgi:hypothetical protein|uniref:hypothetical protein n=1 Tax=Thalassospira TaxID=168934 RepID=UPI001113D9D0|nr:MULTISPECIES: hypothetical protein [Thalassospira]MDM7975836.1 hypothetical protein [Thalassospira xiamenensis]UKV14556.1 hypothetical protein L6172_21340 [Thalassospiraceae bacterium SW-3-3]